MGYHHAETFGGSPSSQLTLDYHHADVFGGSPMSELNLDYHHAYAFGGSPSSKHGGGIRGLPYTLKMPTQLVRLFRLLL